MVRTQKITLVTVVVTMLAALALVVGCSSSSASSSAAASSGAESASASAAASESGAAASAAAASSAAAPAAAQANTLEGYFKDHLAEWETSIAQIQENAGDVMDVDMSVEGNKLFQIMTFKQTYSSEAVAQLKTKFGEGAAGIISEVAPEIKKMESYAQVTGITWAFEYRNGDGELIYGCEIDGDGNIIEL